MFKGSSENSQFRERRLAIESRQNSGGLDESMFRASNKDTSEYNDLVTQKKGLEAKSSQLNAQLKLAKRRYTFREAGQVSRDTIIRWEAERANIRSRVTALDKRLTELKADRRLRNDEEMKTFSEAFLQVAKEMLVEDAYDRLAIAAIHRARDWHERHRATERADI